MALVFGLGPYFMPRNNQRLKKRYNLKIEYSEAEVTSNVPQANKKTMTINVDGLPHIMKTLTNLYRDPQMAVIREYFTNGIDAHIAAGNKAPVEVTLPTWDDPVYTVKDQGVGMSEWDIQNIYSEYGASTKRDSDEQNGAFGLGCKSAFTITNQFTVISVKNSMKTVTLFSRSPAGSYESNVITKVETDEPNGTIVKIPVKEDLTLFNSKAREFFSFVAPGTALVNGKEPESAFTGGRRITDETTGLDIYLKPKSEGQSFVIMGTVPYELTTAELKTALARMNYSSTLGFTRMVKYFTVGIGDVDLTPNREGLMFTDKTNKVIDDHLNFIMNDLKDIAQEEIDATTTLDQFFEVHARWNDIVPVPREWKGEEVPLRLVLDENYHQVERTSYGSIHHSDGHTLTLAPKSGYQTHGKKVIVTGYKSEDYKKVNAYLGNYLTAMTAGSGTFIFSDDPDLLENKWVLMQDRFTFLKGDDIIEIGRAQRKKERLEAAKEGRSVKKITYPVLDLETLKVTWMDYKKIPAGTPYAHYSEVSGGMYEVIRRVYRNQREYALTSDVVAKIKKVTPATKIVLLNASRTEKALTDRIKSTYNLKDDVFKAAEAAEKLVTDEVIKHYSISQSGWMSFMTYTGLDKVVSKIKDKSVREIIEPDQATIDKYNELESTKKALSFARYWRDNSKLELDYDFAVTKDLDAKYPLVNALDKHRIGSATDHLVTYLNAVHEESEASTTV
jgi:predicted SnoaL-like aldol condensation-catalyzing enzyme